MIVSALLQPCYNLLHATCCTVYGGLKVRSYLMKDLILIKHYVKDLVAGN